MEQFGHNLEKLRKAYGYSRKDLADKLGKNQSAIHHWEVGRHEPSLYDFSILCRIFGVTMNDLFYGTLSEDAFQPDPKQVGSKDSDSDKPVAEQLRLIPDSQKRFGQKVLHVERQYYNQVITDLTTQNTILTRTVELLTQERLKAELTAELTANQNGQTSKGNTDQLAGTHKKKRNLHNLAA